MKHLRLLGLILVLVFTMVACEDEDMDTTGTISLNISGLEPLGTGFNYEGWIVSDGIPISTGTFSVAQNGTPSPSTFDVELADLENATMFVVSIEPSPDTDPAPATTKILAGTFSNQTASLTSGIVGDFANAGGSFFLRSPTDEDMGNNNNDENGVWYGIPGAPPTPDFNLPSLPEGWVYEGWVVGESGPLTTGKFTEFNTADDGDPFSGTQPGPPIPGEDFFNNAPGGETFPLDVRGRTIVISVEPVPDDSPAPFVMKPLLGTA